MTRATLIVMLAGLALASASGCSTFQAYPGRERPANETATIVGDNTWFGRTAVRLLEVDAHRRDPTWSDHGARVLGGPHTVYVEAYWMTGSGCFDDHRRAAVTFDVEVGHTYVIKTDEPLSIWVEQSGAGVVPSSESRAGPRCHNHYRIGLEARGYDCPVHDTD